MLPIKCAVRHFDPRVVHDCTVLDSEVQAMFGWAPVQSLLLSFSAVVCMRQGPNHSCRCSKHIAALKGPAHTQARPDLLQELGRLCLGQVRQGCWLPKHAEGHRAIKFYRHTLCPEVSRCLQRLGVPVAFWRPSAEMPPMQGAGRRGAAPKKYHDGLSDGIGRFCWPQQSALNSSL